MVLWFIGYKSCVHEKTMFDGLFTSASQRKGQKFNNAKVSSCHSVIEKSQDGRDGQERNWKKHLMVLNSVYTETRGKSIHYFEDADLPQPFNQIED